MDDIQKLHNSLDYIHNNPVEAGIVEKAEDYLYSSAKDYYGRHINTTAPDRGGILAPNGALWLTAVYSIIPSTFS